MDPTDEELVRRYRTGDASAFDALVDRYARGALRFAAHFLGEAHEAEDVAQECFLKLFTVARNGVYDPQRGRFAPFFFRMLRNLSLDRLRARRPSGPLSQDPAGEEPDGATLAERGETCARVREIVERLPANERAAIALREFEGLSYREIAEALGASLESVKTWIFRARRRIERRWRGEEEA
ncbi:MAG TPA: sigma-70 family RNA polymerase sigma factor [Planctomycetota bacterium]|jgi:RNA polymerase sigma-70 factor (ECF subfamily)|nr:sigma-70 family RNA polymerase sigma factor [Planctomycetota bacterium]